MKIKSNYRSKLLSGALLLAGVTSVMFGCKRVPTIVEGQNPELIFVATVGDPAGTKLTPSDQTQGGEFEVDDSVGIFLFDQQGAVPNAGIYSYTNTKYVASIIDGQVTFSPDAGANTVFYKSYFLHNVYAYYPYRDGATVSAEALPVEVALDQTTKVDYVASDFLTCRLSDVQPQQIDPAAPELAMNFSHQFTSVVVKVRNSDNSVLNVIPVVSIINTNTKAVVDISQATPSFLSRSTPAAIKMQRKSNYVNVNFPNQLCYYGIAVPQELVDGKAVIKVTLGSGITARVFEYVPTASDAIQINGGLAQGKEHVFDFVIKGTELIVQGGEISPWGDGAKSVNVIDGEGKSASKMFFEVVNATGDALTKMQSIKGAKITIDGVVRQTLPFVYDEVNSKISCIYYQEGDWGYDVSEVVFIDEDGTAVMTCTANPALRIKGNPTLESYSTVIAVIDAATGAISAK